MQSVGLAAPFVIGGSVKILYDVVLLATFRRVRVPDEAP
jgi:hypothetical protein